MNSEPPFFSVIVPTCNRPGQLVDICLKALARLSYPRDKYEVIVVNDGSKQLPDRGKALCDDLDLTVIDQPHAGPAVARNNGARRARGDFFAFTDDDCAPARDWLRSLAVHIVPRPCRAVGGRTVNLLTQNVCSSASQLLIDYLYAHYNQDHEDARFFASNNLCVPADLFRAVGGFNETFSLGGEDREFCSRWISAGYRMAYAPQALVYHAHEMTPARFLRQQFTYGRGAWRYRRSIAQANDAGVRFERARFYWNLLCYPLRQKPGLPLAALWSLFLLSQIANGSGFFWEMSRRRKRCCRIQN